MGLRGKKSLVENKVALVRFLKEMQEGKHQTLTNFMKHKLIDAKVVDVNIVRKAGRGRPMEILSTNSRGRNLIRISAFWPQFYKGEENEGETNCEFSGNQSVAS